MRSQARLREMYALNFVTQRPLTALKLDSLVLKRLLHVTQRHLTALKHDSKAYKHIKM